MQRIYDWLIATGYPERGVDWIRRRRLPIIIGLAVLSWALVLGAGWLVMEWLWPGE